MNTAAILFAIAALGGITMAMIRFTGRDYPPMWLAIIHGLFAAAGPRCANRCRVRRGRCHVALDCIATVRYRRNRRLRALFLPLEEPPAANPNDGHSRSLRRRRLRYSDCRAVKGDLSRLTQGERWP